MSGSHVVYRALTDATLLVHLAFIVFVVVGALLTRRRRAWAIVHVPAVAWVGFVEYTQTICPLTAIEKSLRAHAGMADYAGGFVAHYLLPVIHPPGLTSEIQISLALAVVALNVAVYARLLARDRHIA